MSIRNIEKKDSKESLVNSKFSNLNGGFSDTKQKLNLIKNSMEEDKNNKYDSTNLTDKLQHFQFSQKAPLFVLSSDTKIKLDESHFYKMPQKLISIQLDKRFTEKSIIKITGVPNEPNINKEDFQKMIVLLKLANFQKAISDYDIDLPNLLIEIFLRVLIKKRFVLMNISNEVWSVEFVTHILNTDIVKKKEESLKYVIRETFTILTEKYRTIHYIYWHNVDPESSLKIEREQNYYIGFTKYYFGDIMEKNKKMGKKDQINNYTLPNKKNGDLKSNNKSITPQFLKRLFKSKKFYTDFMLILDSPIHSNIKKSLRAVLYEDAEQKLDNWIYLFSENLSYDIFKKMIIKKVSGSKAKLPWFRIEIESAINIVKKHIKKIK